MASCETSAELLDLPEEILEYIFSLTSPYRDLQNLSTVCHRFHRICKVVFEREGINFKRSVADGLLEWSSVNPGCGATISERYSHCAVYHDGSLYVFGGCTSSSTTFNDLWRLDLASRQWVRCLTLGTYPSPKACATMVLYKETLVLFGGWSHPTPYPLHQAARFFNQLHVYSIDSKQWTLVYPRLAAGLDTVPQGIAGHAASVVGDRMIVFGGSHGHGQSCNDLWVLDLDAMVWHIPNLKGPKPGPRYGHSQVVLDDNHILVIGGCTGPNLPLTDMWLLTMGDPTWNWKEIKVNNLEVCPPQLWCRAAAKVGDNVVILSKMSRHQQQLRRQQHQQLFEQQQQQQAQQRGGLKGKNRAPRGSSGPPDGSPKVRARVVAAGGQNGRMGVRLEPQGSQSSRLEPLGCLNPRLEPQGIDSDDIPSRVYNRRPIGQAAALNDDVPNLNDASNDLNMELEEVAPSCSVSGEETEATPSDNVEGAASSALDGASSSDQESTDNSNIPSAAISPSASTLGPPGPSGLPGPSGRLNSAAVLGRTGMPSIRPNAMKNRQKQLETLKRYEERLKQLERSAQQQNAIQNDPNPSQDRQANVRRNLINPMQVHVLNIQRTISEGVVSWNDINTDVVGLPPEETIFFSLHYGRAELIMFGGIQTDLSSMQRDVNLRSAHASNVTHFINARKFLR